jgi:hypothetical protein
LSEVGLTLPVCLWATRQTLGVRGIAGSYCLCVCVCPLEPRIILCSIHLGVGCYLGNSPASSIYSEYSTCWLRTIVVLIISPTRVVVARAAV